MVTRTLVTLTDRRGHTHRGSHTHRITHTSNGVTVTMLTIWMPENRQKKTRSPKRIMWEAIGYVTAAGFIMASLIIAYDSPWWFVPVIVEVWWFWAAISQDWEK